MTALPHPLPRRDERAALALPTGKIESEAGRRVNVPRPLTHSLDLGEEGLAMQATSAMQRLMSRTEQQGDCLIYLGGTTQAAGHALIGYQGKTIGAHRLVWILTHGPIPTGLVVRHGCDVPRCVNVTHLSLGTIADNNRDRDERGRAAVLQGERNGFAKLTDAQARDIKERYLRGEAVHVLSADFGICSTTVYDIANGRRWRHIEALVPIEEQVIGRRGRNYWADRDACKHGHQWTSESTWWRTRNGRRQRVCRICSRSRARKAYARSQEQAVPGVPGKVSGGMTALQRRAIACELRDAAVDVGGAE
jgi:hypothetical protein